MKNVLAVGALFAALGPAAWADGPFGVEIGSDISRYASCSPASSGNGMYTCNAVPKPHSAFESYVLQYAPSTGVCWIKAVGKDIKDNSRGGSTQRNTDEIARQIAINYGPHTSTADFLTPDSIWDEPTDWLMGISEEDRYYGYFWEAEEGFPPRNRVVEIGVLAKATSSDTGYVIVEFSGDNEEACEAEISRIEASVF